MGVLVGALNFLGIPTEEITVIQASAKRQRKEAQKEKAQEIKQHFKDTLPQFGVVHWDGKVTEFLGPEGSKYQDVNAVVFTSPLNVFYQFLGAPVMNDGATGRNLSESTLRLLGEWGIREVARILALVFDTTSSNSGYKEGAAKWLEEALGPVLWNACRHHVYELHVKHPYEALMGATKGKCYTNL